MGQTYVGGVLRDVNGGKLTSTGVSSSTSSKKSSSASSTSMASTSGFTSGSSGGGSNSEGKSTTTASTITIAKPTTPSSVAKYETSIFKADEQGNVYELTKTGYYDEGKFYSSGSSKRYIGHTSDLKTPTPKGEVIQGKEYYYAMSSKGTGFYVPAESVLKGEISGYTFYASKPYFAIDNTYSGAQKESEYEISHALQYGYLKQKDGYYEAPTEHIATHMKNILLEGLSKEYVDVKQEGSKLFILSQSPKTVGIDKPKREYYYTVIGENDEAESVLFGASLPSPETAPSKQQEVEQVKVPIKTFVASEGMYAVPEIIKQAPVSKEISIPKSVYISAKENYATARKNLQFQKELSKASEKDITFKPQNEEQYNTAIKMAQEGKPGVAWGEYYYKGHSLGEGLVYVSPIKKISQSNKIPNLERIFPVEQFTKSIYYSDVFYQMGLAFNRQQPYYKPTQHELQKQEYLTRQKELEEVKQSIKGDLIELYAGGVIDTTNLIKEFGYGLRYAGENEVWSTVPFGLGGVASFPLSLIGTTITLAGKTLEAYGLSQGSVGYLIGHPKSKYSEYVIKRVAETTTELALIGGATIAFGALGKGVSGVVGKVIGKTSILTPYVSSSIVGGASGYVYGLATKPEKATEYAVGGAVLAPITLFASNPKLAEETIDRLVPPHYHLRKSELVGTYSFNPQTKTTTMVGREVQSLYKFSSVYGTKKMYTLEVVSKQTVSPVSSSHFKNLITENVPKGKSFFGVVETYGIGKIDGKQVSFIGEPTYFFGKIMGKIEVPPSVPYIKQLGEGKFDFITTPKNAKIGIYQTGNLAQLFGFKDLTSSPPPSVGFFATQKSMLYKGEITPLFSLARPTEKLYFSKTYVFDTVSDLHKFTNRELFAETKMLIGKQYMFKEKPEVIKGSPHRSYIEFPEHGFKTTKPTSSEITTYPSDSGYTKIKNTGSTMQILKTSTLQDYFSDMPIIQQTFEIKPLMVVKQTSIPLILPSVSSASKQKNIITPLHKIEYNIGIKYDTSSIIRQQTGTIPKIIISQIPLQITEQIITPTQIVVQPQQTIIQTSPKPQPPIVNIIPPPIPPNVIIPPPPTLLKPPSLSSLFAMPTKTVGVPKDLQSRWMHTLTGKALNIIAIKPRVYFGLTIR